MCSSDLGKRWTWSQTGELVANDGKTEFSHIPDCFEWERQEVKKQVRSGEYSFLDEVEVYSMPRCYKFEYLGKATVTHDAENGFTLKGNYRDADYYINRTPLQTNSLHIEYDYCYLKPYDCFDISTEDDSFYCYPTKQNVVTKLAFATEEIYKMNLENTHKKEKVSK